MMHQQDNDLLQRFHKGDPLAFEKIYSQLYKLVNLNVQRLVPQKADAQEIVIDSFIKVWNKRIHFPSMANLTAYLMVTATNACRSFLKKTRKEVLLKREYDNVYDPETDFPDHEEVKQEVLGRVLQEMENLPPKCREVIRLAYIVGMKNSEIAEHLMMDEKTVRNQKTNGLHALRAALPPSIFDKFLVWFVIGCSLPAENFHQHF